MDASMYWLRQSLELLLVISNLRIYVKKNLVFQFYEKYWQQQINKNKDGKLANYVKFKAHFGMEKYLSLLKSPEHRKNFAMLRILAHRLRIQQFKVDIKVFHIITELV